MSATPVRPAKTSLIVETAKALRLGIASGQWKGHLPGERVLCNQWQVSRPTLRAAVELLKREQLLEVGQGRRTRILMQAEAVAARPLTVGLLSPESLESLPPTVMHWVDELRSHLAASGQLLKVTVGKGGFGKKSSVQALEVITSGSPATVWVLYQATETMQRWFEESGLPCVVVGSTFPGVTLPSVDRDYRASCRHAVGALVQRGHRRIAFLLQENRYGGDLESEAGFREGVAAAVRREITGEIVHHNGAVEGICTSLDILLASRARPTALLVARSGYALTVHTHLLRRGVRIPQDMAVLCRDDDAFLDWVVPRMTRYAVSPVAFAKRIYHLVIKLVEEGRAKETGVKVVPAFLGRESV